MLKEVNLIGGMNLNLVESAEAHKAGPGKRVWVLFYGRPLRARVNILEALDLRIEEHCQCPRALGSWIKSSMGVSYEV